MWARLVCGCIAALSLVSSAEAQEKVLNVYNWSDYIGEDTVKNFEAQAGIKVRYDVYDSNEVLEAKLSAGHSGYDIVVPSASPFLARQIKAKTHLKLDKSKLPNYGNLDKEILQRAEAADPGNQYGIPYLWGTTGLGYNVAKVKAALGDKAPTDSLALIFDPENAKKLASCGISTLDTAQEVVPAALAYLGKDPLSRDPKDLQAAVEVLQKIRPYIRKFHSSQYINDLANGDLCLSLGWSGDVVQAKNRAGEAKNRIELAYSIPKEGAMMWIDMLAIPADAPHPENAYKFLDYMLRPEVAAEISNTVAYANPNALATDLVNEEIRNDPGIYPSAEVKKRLYFDTPVTAEYERLRTRAWTRVKTGS